MGAKTTKCIGTSVDVALISIDVEVCPVRT